MGNGAFLVVIVAAALLLITGVRLVPEGRRIGIVRLGRYLGSRGPGLIFTLPFIDRSTVVHLDPEIPGWQSMSPERLNEAVRQRILG